MKVIKLVEDDDGLLLSCDGGDLVYQEDKTGWHIKSGTLRYGDRLVVVPAGEPLPGDTNELTARIHDLEDTVTDLHTTIERLSKDLAEARAEPTVRELCRAYRDWMKRTGRYNSILLNTTMDLRPDGSGSIVADIDMEFLLGWTVGDNPVSIIDAACRPVVEPVELPLVQVWTT